MDVNGSLIGAASEVWLTNLQGYRYRLVNYDIASRKLLAFAARKGGEDLKMHPAMALEKVGIQQKHKFEFIHYILHMIDVASNWLIYCFQSSGYTVLYPSET